MPLSLPDIRHNSSMSALFLIHHEKQFITTSDPREQKKGDCDMFRLLFILAVPKTISNFLFTILLFQHPIIDLCVFVYDYFKYGFDLISPPL